MKFLVDMIEEQVQMQQVERRFVPTTAQWVDVLTKPLHKAPFDNWKAGLKLCVRPHNQRLVKHLLGESYRRLQEEHEKWPVP